MTMPSFRFKVDPGYWPFFLHYFVGCSTALGLTGPQVAKEKSPQFKHAGSYPTCGFS